MATTSINRINRNFEFKYSFWDLHKIYRRVLPHVLIPLLTTALVYAIDKKNQTDPIQSIKEDINDMLSFVAWILWSDVVYFGNYNFKL